MLGCNLIGCSGIGSIWIRKGVGICSQRHSVDFFGRVCSQFGDATKGYNICFREHGFGLKFKKFVLTHGSFICQFSTKVQPRWCGRGLMDFQWTTIQEVVSKQDVLLSE